MNPTAPAPAQRPAVDAIDAPVAGRASAGADDRRPAAPSIARGALSVVITLVLVGGLAGFAYAHGGDLAKLRIASPLSLLLIAPLALIGIVFRAQYLRTLVVSQTEPMSFRAVWKLSMATSLLAHVTLPSVAVSLRAVYLRRVYQLRYRDYARGMLLFTLLWISVSAISGGLALAVIRNAEPAGESIVPATMQWGLCLLAIAGGCAAALVAGLLPRPGWLPLRRWSLGWGGDVPRLGKLAGAGVQTAIACTIVQAASILLAFHALGRCVPASTGWLLSSSQQLGSLAALTPGSVGIQELAGVLFAAQAGMGVAEPLAALLALRLISLVVSVVAGGPALLAARRDMARGHISGCGPSSGIRTAPLCATGEN